MTGLSISQKRILAGRKGGLAKRGKKSEKTLDRQEVLRQYRERVSLVVDDLLNAQLILALGHSVLLKKEKSGKFDIVRDQNEIRHILNQNIHDEDNYRIVTQKPNREAIKDILDRTFGRSIENIDVKGNLTGFSLRDLFNVSQLDQN